jgi:hypothetical protein
MSLGASLDAALAARTCPDCGSDHLRVVEQEGDATSEDQVLLSNDTEVDDSMAKKTETSDKIDDKKESEDDEEDDDEENDDEEDDDENEKDEGNKK